MYRMCLGQLWDMSHLAGKMEQAGAAVDKWSIENWRQPCLSHNIGFISAILAME
jgi:hypothetical protein